MWNCQHATTLKTARMHASEPSLWFLTTLSTSTGPLTLHKTSLTPQCFVTDKAPLKERTSPPGGYLHLNWNTALHSYCSSNLFTRLKKKNPKRKKTEPRGNQEVATCKEKMFHLFTLHVQLFWRFRLMMIKSFRNWDSCIIMHTQRLVNTGFQNFCDTTDRNYLNKRFLTCWQYMGQPRRHACIYANLTTTSASSGVNIYSFASFSACFM